MATVHDRSRRDAQLQLTRLRARLHDLQTASPLAADDGMPNPFALISGVGTAVVTSVYRQLKAHRIKRRIRALEQQLK